MLLLMTVLLLAACSPSALLMENFEEAQELPDGLAVDNLIHEIVHVERQGDYLRLIVASTGRGQSGYVRFPALGALDEGALSVRVRVLAGQVRLWFLRAESGCAGDALGLDPTLDRYRLSRAGEDCRPQTLDDQSRLEVELNQWYQLQIEARGDTVRGMVDAVTFFEAPLEGGAAGFPALEIFSDSQAPGRVEVDEIAVYE